MRYKTRSREELVTRQMKRQEDLVINDAPLSTASGEYLPSLHLVIYSVFK